MVDEVKPLLGSWRTTLAGLLATLVGCLPQLLKLADGDPATSPDWNVVIPLLLLGLGLSQARDHLVTSKSAGLGILLVAFLSGCSPAKAYLLGDRATYDAVAREYVAYVGSDATLTLEQVERRNQTIRSWEARLNAAEKE